MSANWILRKTMRQLGIKKHITNYSFKRNGVTARYIAGEPAQNIQKIAGWTSTEQLKTYDLSTQDDFFEQELIKKGVLIPQGNRSAKLITYKLCSFCNAVNPKSNENCSNCSRPLDRDTILKEETKKEETIADLKREVAEINKTLMALGKEQLINK